MATQSDMSPSPTEITAKLKDLRLKSPDIGKKKMLAQVNAENGWTLTTKDFKGFLQTVEKEHDEETAKACTERKKEESADAAKAREEQVKAQQAEALKASRVKCNGFLIRAAPASPTTKPFDDIPGQVSPFHFQSYGDETGEMRELKARLAWKTAHEAGKFYDSLGSNQWYYYVYGNSTRDKPVNEVASRVCHSGQVRGDVVVIRSGPAGLDTPEEFTKAELCRDLEFYKTRNAQGVFAEREKSRAMGIVSSVDPPY